MPTKKPTILFVITQGGPWGGAQKYVFDLANGIRREFEVVIAVGEPTGQQDLQKEAAHHGIAVHQLRHLVRSISPVNDFLAIRELRNLYKKISPDIVHLNSSKAGVLGSFAAKQLPSIHVIYTVHGWVFNEPMNRVKRRFYQYLERTSAEWKEGIIVLSRRDHHDALRTLHIPLEKINAVYDLDIHCSFLPSSSARAAIGEKLGLHFHQNAYLIGCIANFYRTKGLDILLEAIASVREKLPNTHAILIGDGPERIPLENLRKKLSLTDIVHLPGFIPEAAMYLKAFDLFVLPSRKEGMPYALLEAAAAAIPIIATDVGDIPFRFHHSEIIHVQPENVDALSEQLIFAKEHPQKMKEMAASMQTFNHSTGSMLEKTISLYRSLLVKSH